MAKRKTNKRNTDPVEEVPQSDYNSPWITDGAWKTGCVGILAILGIAYYYAATDVFEKGLNILYIINIENKLEAIFAALAFTAIMMILAELIRLYLFDPKNFIKLRPKEKNADHLNLVLTVLKRYFLNLLVFFLCKVAYYSIGEYGYIANNAYYTPWFYALEVLWWTYVIWGIPYIIVTVKYRHDEEKDKKDLSTLMEKAIANSLSIFPITAHLRMQWEDSDKKAFRGLLVKFFFAPVMTVFFYDQFSHLENNFGHFINVVNTVYPAGNYNVDIFLNDLKNTLSSVIFSIDVGLAWVGYVVSSRWVDNTTVSAEPTLLGWIVCVMSYPPFRVIGGWFLIGPGEGLIYALPNQYLIGFFSGLMMFSYFLYMLPTVWFGVRFSNLTHRGIIRKGPFAIVRHPAYAAKNIAWWIIGTPAVIYIASASEDLGKGALYFAGMVFMTTIYYLRAITEERHLSADPVYREYCQHVKYRFIPGVW